MISAAGPRLPGRCAPARVPSDLPDQEDRAAGHQHLPAQPSARSSARSRSGSTNTLPVPASSAASSAGSLARGLAGVVRTIRRAAARAGRASPRSPCRPGRRRGGRRAVPCGRGTRRGRPAPAGLWAASRSTRRPSGELDRLQPARPAAGRGAFRDRAADRAGRSPDPRGPRPPARPGRGSSPGARPAGRSPGRRRGRAWRAGPAAPSSPCGSIASIRTSSEAKRRSAPISAAASRTDSAASGVLDPDQRRPARAEDARLLAGDRGEGVPQVLLVVEADRGDQREDADRRGWWRRAGRRGRPRRTARSTPSSANHWKAARVTASK